MGARGLVIVVLGSLVVYAAPARAWTAREFERPHLTFPTGIAVAPDGAVWVASMYADKLVRLDPKTGQTSVVGLPLRSHPRALVVAPDGTVWYSASGLGLVGRIEPGRGRAAEFPFPSATKPRAIAAPWSLTLDRSSETVWFTVPSDGLVGRLPTRAQPRRRGFDVQKVPIGSPASRLDGIAVDAEGTVWVTEMGGDALVRIDPVASAVRRLHLAPGSRPRGIAAAPDGGVWVALAGADALLRVDRWQRTLVWPMPEGPPAEPQAVAVDGTGAVWVSQLARDALARLDPRTGRFTVVRLPSRRSGVRALAVDRTGRVWFAASGSGRLGVVE